MGAAGGCGGGEVKLDGGVKVYPPQEVSLRDRIRHLKFPISNE